MRRFTFRLRVRLMISLAVALVACGGIVLYLLPDLLRRQAIKAVKDNCPQCELLIGQVRFRLLPGSVVLMDTQITAGTPGRTQVHAETTELHLSISPLRMAAGTIHFSEINFVGLAVTLSEGDAPRRPPAPADKSEDGDGALFDFSIARLTARDAKFAYVRTEGGRTSRLDISRIQLEVDGIGTSERYLHAKTHGRATALLEQTGKVDLEVTSSVFVNPLDVDVDLRVRDQNLADLAYFRTNDGIALRGVLNEGRGRVRMRGRELQSWVYANYRDFGVKFSGSSDRSGMLAFFMNLGTGLVMYKENDDESLKDQTRAVKIERRERESPVGFILRGLKEAALKIAKRSR